MPLYQAIVLAVVQGLAEFLPISSTAHLVLFPWLLGWKDPGLTFDVALHAGTLVAVLLYFWRYWLEMLGVLLGRDWGGNPGLGLNRRLLWFLLAASVPAGVAGWLFEHAAEEELRSPIIIGLALVIVGVLMWAGEHAGSRQRGLNDVGLVDSLLVGLAQAFAVIPGVSRSGSTMTAGLFRGMKRETSARFSFLLSTPIIAGAALKKGLEIRHTGLPPEMRLPFLLGVVVAGLVGYLVIAVLIRYLEHRTFRVFIVYRIALGVLVLALGWGMGHA
ncbi:MAG: undecaprenyl-diphosphate phosphatase [Acidobacteriia bacterium]|nr:undecaprenyl-diphosphate phosphatase [Terriglobia bacterium]